MHIVFALRMFCFLFYLCLRAAETTGTEKKPTLRLEEELGSDVLDKARTTDPYLSWYGLKAESTRAESFERYIPLTSSTALKDESRFTAFPAKPFPSLSALLAQSPEQQAEAHTLPSEFRSYGSRLTHHSSSFRGDARGEGDVSTGWASLEGISSFVETSAETPPSSAKHLIGERQSKMTLLSTLLLKYQEDQISFTANKQRFHRRKQTESSLKDILSTQQTISGGSAERSVSTETDISLDNKNVHPNSTMFEIDMRRCSDSEDKYDIIANHGTVSLLRRNTSGTFDASITCTFRIIVPFDRFVSVSFDEVLDSEKSNIMLYILDCDINENYLYGMYLPSQKPPDLYSSVNCLEFGITSSAPFPQNILITFTSSHSRLALNLTLYTERCGFVTTPFFDGISSKYPPNLKVSTALTLPHKYSSILVSFELFALKDVKECITFWGGMNSTSRDNPLNKVCGTDMVRAQLFNTSLQIEFLSIPTKTTIGFKMFFSFHTQEDEPQVARNGRFNCTSPNYELFKHHVDCNLIEECENNEDELGCWYSSITCKGAIACGKRCYYYVAQTTSLTWNEASQLCFSRNSDLASLNTIEEAKAVLKIVQSKHQMRKMFVGLKTYNPNLPKMYKSVLQWNDGKMAFDLSFDKLEAPKYPSCGMIYNDENRAFRMIDCDTDVLKEFLCEFFPAGETKTSLEPASIHNTNKNNSNNDNSIPLLETVANQNELRLRLPETTTCPDGHVTHDFLSCDPATDCLAETDVDTCETENGGVIPLFICEEGVQTLAFTLVCNHQEDCRDGSDEDRCVFEECEGFLCDNLQCIRVSEVCDGMDHCLTGRDEDFCSQVASSSSSEVIRVVNTSVVTLDGYGHYDVISNNRLQEQVKQNNLT